MSGNPYSPPPVPSAAPLGAGLTRHADGKGLSVEFDLSMPELVDANVELMERTAASRWILVFYWVGLAISAAVMLVVIGAVVLLGSKSSAFLQTYLPEIVGVGGGSTVIAGVFVMAIATHRWLIRLQLAAHLKNNKGAGVTGPRTVTITPHGITQASEHSQLIYRWSGIEQIEIRPAMIYVLITKVSGFVVPLGAFRDAQEFQEFATLTKQYLDAAS